MKTIKNYFKTCAWGEDLTGLLFMLGVAYLAGWYIWVRFFN